MRLVTRHYKLSFVKSYPGHLAQMEPRSATWTAAPEQFRAQWVAPGDVFSVLLILGADVIQLALAATSGAFPFTPVAFSFGWVAYGIAALLGSLGENRLIRCAPEVSLRVFNLKSGHVRDNHSWLLGRLVATHSYWQPKEASKRLRITMQNPEMDSIPESIEIDAALCVAIYKPEKNGKAYTSRSHNGRFMTRGFRSALWWSGIGTSILQLGVAAIPFGLYHDWAIFITTFAGTILAYTTASLPQWALEKRHARQTKNKPVALTTGNGSQEVIIVRSETETLDLEDLACGRAPRGMVSTRVSTFLLSVLWIALLITCTGIKENTWYLLAVGGLGILHNLVVAAVPRSPASLGLPLVLEDHGVYKDCKVMLTLMKLELENPGYGKALVGEFFPGGLSDEEKEWWDLGMTERKREDYNVLKAAKEREVWQKNTKDKKEGFKALDKEPKIVKGDENV